VGAELAALLTAAIAVSMALTPLAMTAYEQIAIAADAAIPDVQHPDPTFDDGEPDIIVAGFGRVGQIVQRLLSANGLRATTLDSDIEQIEVLRKFGRRVHYGDATRLDLLRAAGAERAKMLIVAIDDKDKALELVETAKAAFPHLKVVARAWDRPHAYALLHSGADAVEREAFEGALALGAKALEQLGYAPAKARKAADVFRQYDARTFEKLLPLWGGEDEAYLLAAREAARTTERLLEEDMKQQLRPAGGTDGAQSATSKA
jgi:voltage-gated potassium channel Kch